ncbi:flagellar protein FliT [Variovorax sp. J22R115]|uniref:flagellar protein FliT n=1 Tax=Variovorax sp. J22R115 TaxID=3053509 RepID=UPI002575750A|nr:flagellar protein FliT [Variovorax sp. J22R115]MDM0052392.1 flagellar protein FliT [Variovorax sp. J22R115]
MATTSEVVHCYDQLAARVALMAELARAKDWARLPELEAQCSALVERLKVIQPLEALDPAQFEGTRRLIERIRAHQDEVCGLVKPQIEQLIARMSLLSQQRSLDRAYGPPH